MSNSRQVNLQQWLQQGIPTTPINPLKIQKVSPHRPLTTPPHRIRGGWSGVGVVWVDWVGWVNRGCGCVRWVG